MFLLMDEVSVNILGVPEAAEGSRIPLPLPQVRLSPNLPPLTGLNVLPATAK